MVFWKRAKSSQPEQPQQPPLARTQPPAGASVAPGPGRPTLPALSEIKHVIAIASGKGGVGKSTVTTNLAVALRATGASVGLLDADIYGPSQPGLLGAGYSKPEMVEGQLRPLEKYGIRFVSMASVLGSDAPVVWRAPMAMKMIHQFLGNVEWGALDYLLIDLPPGTGDVQLTLAQQASLSGAVIVTTPQEVAVGIAKKGLKMFEQLNVPILGIVENMSGFSCKHCGKETAVFKEGGGQRLARELKVPFLGSLPLDPEIMMSGEEGLPVLERSRESHAAHAILELARNVESELARRAGDIGEREPIRAEVMPNGQLVVQWPDGHLSQHSAYRLRTQCGCATCVDENTGKRILDPSRVPLDIQLQGFAPVGRYAFSMMFSDGHSTGIYPFKKLRELCECDACRKKTAVGAAESFFV